MLVNVTHKSLLYICIFLPFVCGGIQSLQVLSIFLYSFNKRNDARTCYSLPCGVYLCVT